MNFISLIKPYQKRIAFILFCIFFSNLLSLALPWFIKIMLDRLLPAKDSFMLSVFIFGLGVVLLIRSLLNFLRKKQTAMLGEIMVYKLRADIFKHLRKISLRSLKHLTPAQILTRISVDTESVRAFIASDLAEFIYAMLSTVFIVCVLAWINIRLTIVAIAGLPLFAVFYFRVLPKLRCSYKLLKDSTADMVSGINEILCGMSVVRIFSGFAYEYHRFLKLQQNILKNAKDTYSFNALLWSGMDFFSSFGIVCILWMGGIEVIKGVMTAGDLVAFYSYLGMLFSPLIRLGVINSSYQEASAALVRINDIFSISDEVKVVSHPVKLAPLMGKVEFKDVSFAYQEGEYVLDRISFSVESGEVIAIVGASGAGKTTLINLLLRFYDPSEGDIFIDNHNLRYVDLDSYRRQIAVVFQDDYLFSGRVIDNMRYGRRRSSLQEIRDSAIIAQAHDFVSGMKEGYFSCIGERGEGLSAGQRQRIAIARALIRDPAMLILDEATSAVDAITENAIQQAISRKMRGKTVFVIAHRFSTIMNADKIIVLDKARIVEMGTHKELLARDGFYRQLYREQFDNNFDVETQCY